VTDGGPDVVVLVEVVGGGEQVELAAADLWAAGATAVAESGTDVVTLTASFPNPEAARTVAAEIGGEAVEITDTSWQDRWKEFAEPVEVGELVVAPAWREVAVGDGRLVVRIDPGPCFGSGTHASTRLLLGELMERAPLAGTVLDVGCGSGILSVTAALLGATVTAIDIDPDAVTYTRENAAANEVAERVRVSTDPVEATGGGFELALVNVTAGVHSVLGPAVMAAVRPGGTLLLAGLLPGQWRHVTGAYTGAELLDRRILDGWEGATLRLMPPT
jgi:ribosomal protein L11 methyltransferase